MDPTLLISFHFLCPSKQRELVVESTSNRNLADTSPFPYPVAPHCRGTPSKRSRSGVPQTLLFLHFASEESIVPSKDKRGEGERDGECIVASCVSLRILNFRVNIFEFFHC